eukprot:2351028-Amphidinium_carterae.1
MRRERNRAEREIVVAAVISLLDAGIRSSGVPRDRHLTHFKKCSDIMSHVVECPSKVCGIFAKTSQNHQDTESDFE